MTRFLALLAAILVVSATLAVPAQAQQRVVKPHYKAPRQPRAFNQEERRRQAQRMKSRTRTRVIRPRTTRPRFYDTRAAERVSRHIRGRRTKARANRSPRRAAVTPRFYNTRSAVRTAKQTRLRMRKQYVRPHRAKKRRITPTFWR